MAHREHDVVDPAGLAAAREALGLAAEVAVDLETNQMHAYRGRLCFVQLATDEDLWVVDTLVAEVGATGLAGPLADPRLRKVFHDAQGDLGVLAAEGVEVRGIFDTHRAATLLGLPKVGLGDLVAERFGVRLAKEHQTADFAARPLPPEVRAYVADDVRHLLPLARALEADARAAGISEELELEFARLEAEGRDLPAQPRARLPAGAPPVAHAIAAAAEALRHREAAARDVPVGRVLPNAAIQEIAARRPRTMQELSRLRGVKGSFVRVAGQEMLDAIARAGGQAERGELPAPEPAPRRDPRKRDREAALKVWRAEAAKARGVTPSVVLPTYLVERLSASPPRDESELRAVPWLGDKRAGLYGTAILDVLQGAGGKTT